MAAVEVGTHRERYDISSPVCHELLRHPLIVCPSFDGVFGELTTAGVDMCVVSIIAVCSALGITCDSYYLPGLANVSPPLTTTITSSCSSADLSIKIMWTTMHDVPDTGDVRINHFVPLGFEHRHIASTLPGEVCVEQTDVGDQQNAIIANGDHAVEPRKNTTEDRQNDVSADVDDCTVQPLRKRRRGHHGQMSVAVKDAESVPNDVSSDNAPVSQID